eukprot:19826_1
MNENSIPSKGITIWLDSTKSKYIEKDNNDRVTRWKSVDGKTTLTPMKYLPRLKGGVNPKPPYFVAPQHQESFLLSKFPGIQVDYLHTFRISPPLKSVQTICSYHSFNQILDHKDIFYTTQDRGSWCNFYLFGSTNSCHYPFHTGGNVNNQHRVNIRNNDKIGTLYSGYSKSFGKGTISLDGNEFIDIKNASHWTHSGIAITQSPELMNNLQIDLIGAERQCHHYSGILHEIIVYDRTLNDDEINIVLSYFFNKYHGDTVAAFIHSLRDNWKMIDELIQLFVSFILPKGIIQLGLDNTR